MYFTTNSLILFHSLPSSCLLLPTKSIDSSNRGEYLLSHSTSRGVLLLLPTGEGSRDFAKQEPKGCQYGCQAEHEQGKSPLLSHRDNETGHKGCQVLDGDG